MERIASVTSSYYKFADAAVLVFALDSPESFNTLSQHLLEIVSYAENAKIYLCGNKMDLKTQIQVTDEDMTAFWSGLQYENFYTHSFSFCIYLVSSATQ